MPPKRAKGVAVDVGEQKLRCEWEHCTEAFVSMQSFIDHLTQHITNYYNTSTGNAAGLFECKWRECGSQVTGHSTDFNRHVYFHAFHVKIKNVGTAVVEKSKLSPCQMDSQSRNLIPELPERLHCGWSMCEVVYDNPEYFYMHMDMHASNFPDGNHVPGGCKCQWEGCDTTVKSKYKLREHLRSHTQEKMIACPVCGALFSSRSKFLDHLKRQGTAEVQCYECSHCNKRFTSERLLRDHMRHHVNHYKCLYCDMTCPTPSGLRNHLRYRHTEHRPFKCDQCDYSCKSSHDLRKHMDTHTIVKTYQCHMTGCEFTARSYASLSHHFTKEHQGLEAARYACHVCSSVFTRGYHLTLHLKRMHKFKWPSGHCRFRYKPSEDGFLRLQTVRYESVELMDQIEGESPSTSATDQPQQNQENVAPLEKTASSSNIQQSACSPSEHVSQNMSADTDSSKCTENEGSATDNMAYNLEMLGDVALHGPSSSRKNFRTILPKPSVHTSEQQQQTAARGGQFYQGTSQQEIVQGTSQQTLLGTGQLVLQGTGQFGGIQGTREVTVPSIVTIPQGEGGVEGSSHQLLTLQNMNHSGLGSGVYTLSVQNGEQGVCYQMSGQVMPLTSGNMDGYVLCSPSMEAASEESCRDSMDDGEEGGVQGGEADIFRLQRSKAR